MRVLLVKTSSLGDIVHTLPALTDAAIAVPGIQFDWVVEEDFADLPPWHPAVASVIAVSLRRWRRGPVRAAVRGRLPAFLTSLRASQYDLVLDAQGLMKSAVIARLARGPRAGLDRASAREPLAAFVYQRRVPVARAQHAVVRVRQLFAAALGYSPPEGPADFGLRLPAVPSESNRGPYLVFLHGSSWPSKLWPVQYWTELGRRATAAGYGLVLPWFDSEEERRAERIAESLFDARPAPPMPLAELAHLLAQASAVVGVDTGLTHLAGALERPVVTLYGATDPALTAAVGVRVANLQADFKCSPCLKKRCRYSKPAAVKPACYATLGPELVWRRLEEAMADDRQRIHAGA